MPRRRRKNKKYSAELKLQSVEDYLSGKGNLEKISQKYEIVHYSSLQQWIKWYNGHKGIKIICYDTLIALV